MDIGKVMRKTFIRIIDDDEIVIDAQQDFIDDHGNRHPRNVLWLWNEDDLWDILHIKVVWIDEPSEILDDVQIPKQPELPLPVLPPEKPLPPAPPAPPSPAAAPQNPIIGHGSMMLPVLQDAGVEITDDVLKQITVLSHSDAGVSQLVAYGGIAFRTLEIKNKGGYHQGHRHNYDHMTNLIQGSVLCEVDGAPPKRYDAPCQITIAADHWHKFTALTDGVVYQCVYRQVDREDLYTAENSPYGIAPFTQEELLEKLNTIDNPCAHCSCENE
jgi:hypothetical protein